MADLVGKRIGQYHVEALLGDGGMATVYRARHGETNHIVALKIIHADLADTDVFVKRFEREAETASQLSHPHILKIIEYGRHKKTCFIAMELLTGGGLDRRLRQGPLSLESTGQFLDQIASALIYAHGQGIIHRDLKPQNIMLNDRGDAVLTDFGLAKLVIEGVQRTVLTQTGAQVGTPAYMSPEQWKGQAVDARSDVYALGLLLYEMLTGVMPFKAENAYDLMHKHLYMPPPSMQKLRPELPVGLDGFMRRALAKDRVERYQSVAELQQEFHDVVRPVDQRAPASPPQAAGSLDEQTLIVSPSQAAAQERDAIARLQAEQQATPALSRSRLVNPLPQDVGARYIGRAKQVADVANLLTEKTRLVSIYGRGGVGKTALACKALSDLLAAESGPDGVVCLSAASTGISLDRILTAFGKLLGGDDKILLDYLARDSETPPEQKVAVLLEKLARGHYILLLDNLESLQDSSTGALTDPDLQALFDVALGQGSELRILMTSREPLALARPLKTWERLIPLDEGLPIDEAVTLLRAFDPDNAAGLRDASDDQLRDLAEKTDGFPRALEAIAGLLLEDPLLSVDQLAQDVALLSGEITAQIVQRAITRLSPEALRVMEALALFERPANQTALAYLLAPYLDTANLRAILGRLVGGYFASFNKATQEFSLHAIDRSYCFQIIPAGSPEDRTAAPAPFTRYALHARAAEFYRLQAKPQAEWRAIDDLAPQLAEIDHRLAADDYDEAARVLLAIDRDYLWEWGQAPRLNELHGRLRGRISDLRLAAQSLRRFAWTRFFVNLDETTAIFEQLLQEARTNGDRQMEADALDDLAQTHRGRNDLRGGFELHRQALEIYRETGDRRGQADALGGMGACVHDLFPDQAIGYLQEAAAIQRELGNRHSLAFLARTLGGVYGVMGRTDEAIASFQETLAITGDYRASPMGTVMTLSMMGQVYVYLGEYQTALDYGRQAKTIFAEFFGGQITSRGAGVGMIFFLMLQAASGEIEEAIETLRQVMSEGSPLSLMQHGFLAFLLLRTGDIDEAYQLITPLPAVPMLPTVKVAHGIIDGRAGNREAAIASFETVVGMTQMASSNVQALYPRAHALAGLGLLTGDESKIQAAADTYRQARSLGRLPGLEQWELGFLDALMQCPGGEALAPARAAMTEAL